MYEQRSSVEAAVEHAAKYPFERFLIKNVLERWQEQDLFFRHLYERCDI
jgi:hypothetical protein